MCLQAQGYVERLDQEIMELQQRDAELRQILETEDNVHFLQVHDSRPEHDHSTYIKISNIYEKVYKRRSAEIPAHSLQNFPALSIAPEPMVPKVLVNPEFSFGEVTKTATSMKEHLDDICKKEMGNISKKGNLTALIIQ